MDGTVSFVLRKAASGDYKASVAELKLTGYTWDVDQDVEWVSYKL